MYFTYFESFILYRNTRRHLKRLITAAFGRSEQFHNVRAVSAPSLHRESVSDDNNEHIKICYELYNCILLHALSKYMFKGTANICL